MADEQSVIVNDNDEVIGSKNREKIDPQKDIYRVSALWLTNSMGEILLAQRHRNKPKDPGKWGPAVAGTVQKGESYYDNIVKETKEELGLADISFTQGP